MEFDTQKHDPFVSFVKKNQYEWCREFQYSGEPKSHASADKVAGFSQHQGHHARALVLNGVQREHGATLPLLGHYFSK